MCNRVHGPVLRRHAERHEHRIHERQQHKRAGVVHSSEVQERLRKGAVRTSCVSALEDAKDAALATHAEQAMQDGEQTVTLDEIRRELGL